MNEGRKENENLEANDDATAADVAEAHDLKQTPSRPSISIDGDEFDASNISQEAKKLLESLRFVEQRVAALRNELAICQTAQRAYLWGLKAAIEDIV